MSGFFNRFRRSKNKNISSESDSPQSENGSQKKLRLFNFGLSNKDSNNVNIGFSSRGNDRCSDFAPNQNVMYKRQSDNQNVETEYDSKAALAELEKRIAGTNELPKLPRAYEIFSGQSGTNSNHRIDSVNKRLPADKTCQPPNTSYGIKNGGHSLFNNGLVGKTSNNLIENQSQRDHPRTQHQTRPIADKQFSQSSKLFSESPRKLSEVSPPRGLSQSH